MIETAEIVWLLFLLFLISIKITPWVAREVVGMFLLDILITLPFEVVINKSSSFVIVCKLTNLPFFSVTLSVLTPLPARDCNLYSLATVLLPYPF